jgi:hypothetical protein
MAESSSSANTTETGTATVHPGPTSTSPLQATTPSTHQVSCSRWKQKPTMPSTDMLLSTSTMLLLQSTFSPLTTQGSELPSSSKSVPYHSPNLELVIQHEKGIKEGSWDSIHVVSVNFQGSDAQYRVGSTVFLRMESSNDSYGDLDIAGSLSKSVLNPSNKFCQ